MPDRTLTLRLDGTVLLKKYRAVVHRFTMLVGALTAHRHASSVEWIIADLQPGSAMMTIEGIGAIEQVLDVKESYEDVGETLARGERLVQYPRRVALPAEALSRFAGNGIETVAFETEHVDAIIRADVGDIVRLKDSVQVELVSPSGEVIATRGTPRQRPPAYGAVSGQVETLARRGALRFVIYDTLHNKAVSCYLAEGSEEKMRDVWGHWATVEGLVTRDPVSGRPVSVRQITKITKRPERSTSYRDARGASPYTAVLPEDLIRRIRDAG